MVHQLEVSHMYSTVQQKCWNICMPPLTEAQRKNSQPWNPRAKRLPSVNEDTPDTQKECIDSCVSEFFDVLLVRPSLASNQLRVHIMLCTPGPSASRGRFCRPTCR